MEHATPPSFRQPVPFVSPTVQSLTQNDELYLEKGIQFSRYIPIKPIDKINLIKSNGVLNYFYRDPTAYINTKRIFLEIEFDCTLDNDEPILQTHFVSAANVMSHSMIDTAILNIG